MKEQKKISKKFGYFKIISYLCIRKQKRRLSYED